MAFPMFWMNETSSLAILHNTATTNVTGDPSLTLLFLFIMLIFLCFMFRLPLELAVILTLPFVLSVMSFEPSTDFWNLGVFVFIYIGLLLARHYFISR